MYLASWKKNNDGLLVAYYVVGNVCHAFHPLAHSILILALWVRC